MVECEQTLADGYRGSFHGFQQYVLSFLLYASLTHVTLYQNYDQTEKLTENEEIIGKIIKLAKGFQLRKTGRKHAKDQIESRKRNEKSKEQE